MVLFILAIFGYILAILIQMKFYHRGLLTENIFVFFQIFSWALLIITSSLMFSATLEAMLIGFGLLILIFIAGIPLARQVYRKYFVRR